MTVYLVGAGPGDPGLLTVRGAEVLATADVVVYDRLSVSALLELAPPSAELLSVGKAPGKVEVPQSEINELLVAHGREGRSVVRLKGGDPFVFARGGEEAAALAAHGIPFEVVPGITSAIAAPAYAGIPVTLRYSSTSFTVVTGHEAPGEPGDGGGVDWEAIARVGGTIIILMGVARIAAIAQRLIAGGLDAATPVASVTWGTRPAQRTVRATLGTIAAQHLESPATIVVGAVAAQELAWFETRPLFGRSVVVTRARRQAPVLSKRLRSMGAHVVEVPTIAIADPADGGIALQRAASAVAAGAYEWVVLTSANGARRFLDVLRDARDLGGVSVAAIGTETSAALLERNVVADLVPERAVGEGLVDAFPPWSGSGTGRVLLPQAAIARDVVPKGLAAIGWSVDVVEAYRTEAVVPEADLLADARGADAITFTSSSTVEHFVAAAGVEGLPPLVACIGPVTAASAARLGVDVGVVAEVHTIDGLLAALVAALDGQGARA
jgi:uroporphyrinogen III methyltransferase/synthase